MAALSLSITFLCILVALSGAQSKLKVSIYYEALCYDSSEFITQLFYPSYLRLHDQIQPDFIPYGKAIHNKINGTWIFECQHGEKECYGNLMQACALAQTQNQTIQVDFVKCVMSARSPADNVTLLECAKLNNISWSEMVSCSTNGTGQELLALYGDRTFAVEPNIAFVPTIIYDDVFDAKLQEDSLFDFYDTVIKLLNKNRRTRRHLA